MFLTLVTSETWKNTLKERADKKKAKTTVKAAFWNASLTIKANRMCMRISCEARLVTSSRSSFNPSGDGWGIFGTILIFPLK